LNRVENYIFTLKAIYMFWILGAIVIAFIAGFFIGANNPPKSILQGLLKKHQDSINKIMKS